MIWYGMIWVVGTVVDECGTWFLGERERGKEGENGGRRGMWKCSILGVRYCIFYIHNYLTCLR